MLAKKPPHQSGTAVVILGTSLRDAFLTPPEAGSSLHGREPWGLSEAASKSAAL